MSNGFPFKFMFQELEKLLDVLKHAHELLSKDLLMDAFSLMLSEMQENISLVSYSSRLASQVRRSISLYLSIYIYIYRHTHMHTSFSISLDSSLLPSHGVCLCMHVSLYMSMEHHTKLHYLLCPSIPVCVVRKHHKEPHLLCLKNVWVHGQSTILHHDVQFERVS